MNYIKQLQTDLAVADATITEIAGDLHDLLAYVQSDKFRGGHELDGYVNVNDIVARLSPAISKAGPR